MVHTVEYILIYISKYQISSFLLKSAINLHSRGNFLMEKQLRALSFVHTYELGNELQFKIIIALKVGIVHVSTAVLYVCAYKFLLFKKIKTESFS